MAAGLLTGAVVLGSVGAIAVSNLPTAQALPHPGSAQVFERPAGHGFMEGVDITSAAGAGTAAAAAQSGIDAATGKPARSGFLEGADAAALGGAAAGGSAAANLRAVQGTEAGAPAGAAISRPPRPVAARRRTSARSRGPRRARQPVETAAPRRTSARSRGPRRARRATRVAARPAGLARWRASTGSTPAGTRLAGSGWSSERPATPIFVCHATRSRRRAVRSRGGPLTDRLSAWRRSAAFTSACRTRECSRASCARAATALPAMAVG